MLPDTILTLEETGDRINEAMEETRRAGAGELHNISSFAGGTVAQEALKLLTRQYVPLDNTFVFDGVKSRGGMFRL
jgi:amyloid beta precursor protein binding protein 1